MSAPRARVLRRRIEGVEVGAGGVTRLLGCIETPDDRRRWVFGAGTPASAFDLSPALGRAVVESAVTAGGAALITTRGTPGPLALRAGGVFEAAAQAAEPGLLAGRNVIMGCRVAETPAQVAEGLAYHAHRFGATGALILDRTPDPDPAFDAALAEALGALDLSVVLVTHTLPLGRPGDPSQAHVHHAPAAPGRARAEPPPPDPWRAPLGEPLVHELLRRAFLSDARAVLALDASDIVAPDVPNPFDLCVETPGGCVVLDGTPVYPRRHRPGEPSGFGDHVCRQADARAAITRFGTAPRRAGEGRLWRLVRVAGMDPDDLPRVPFLRAMAVRIPDTPPARLAPKSALVEDARLVELARDMFGRRPARAAAPAPRPAGPANDRTTIVTAMKNEGPFLLEWIAFHRMIGVTDILVYTNDCTDGTDAFLDLLAARGLCTHRRNPWRPGDEASPQHTAFQAAEDEAVVREAGWLICMDVDEFINIRLGDGTLADLRAAMGPANMISLTWRLFGDSGHVAFEDRPVIARFDRCAPEIVRKPHQAWGFKTLFRNDGLFRKLGVHRPKGLVPDRWDDIRWVNGSGRPMPPDAFRTAWRSTLSTYGYDWVQLNHYAVRSAESFLVKRDRGRVNHTDRDQGLNYWFRMSHNAETDRTIARMVPRLEAEVARLLSDPEIRAAHDLCVARHRAKIAELLARPDQRRFFEELTGERMRRLCARQHHFGAAVFNAGPHVIPDDIALAPDLPGDFFFTVEHAGEASH